MKNYLSFKRLSVAILVGLSIYQPGNCQTLLVENFSYPAGTNLTSNGWNAHSSAGINPVTVVSPGLVFQGYPSSDVGLSALLANTGEDVNKTFPAVTTGTLFCSFLVKVNNIDNDYFLHLSGMPVGNNYKGRIFINGTGSSFNIGLSKGSGSVVYTTGAPFLTGTVYLIVLKYLIVEGASNDEVSLFLISGSVPASEPVIATIGPLADADQSDLGNLSSVSLRQNSASLNIQVDGIRIAAKWEDALGSLTGSEMASGKDDPFLFPVPAKNELNISNILNLCLIEILDLSGRKFFSMKTDGSGNVRIPVISLSAGVYLVRFTSSSGVKNKIFVKY